MSTIKRITMISFSSAVVLTVLVATVALFAFVGQASADTVSFSPQTQSETGFNLPNDHRGPRDFGKVGQAQDEYLADALGISVDELQAARQTATDQAVQQALDSGLITQEQADRLLLWGGPFRGLPGDKAGDTGIDFDTLLADALGISVEQLQAAKTEAQQAHLADAVADGTITQEQADQILAGLALKDYLDPQALIADAFGMTSEEMQAARDEGKTISEILQEQGLNAITVRENMQAAREAAISQAVADGVITQDQADQFNLRLDMPGFGPNRRGGHDRMPGGFNRDGGDRGPDSGGMRFAPGGFNNQPAPDTGDAL